MYILEFQGPYGPLRNSSPCRELARFAHNSSFFAKIHVNTNLQYNKSSNLRPGNNSQLSCSLARKSENFCGKYVIYAEKMQNIRRKCIEINSFYRNSKKSIEKLDGSQHSQNIFDKPREIFQIISASLNNFLQLGC